MIERYAQGEILRFSSRPHICVSPVLDSKTSFFEDVRTARIHEKGGDVRAFKRVSVRIGRKGVKQLPNIAKDLDTYIFSRIFWIIANGYMQIHGFLIWFIVMTHSVHAVFPSHFSINWFIFIATPLPYISVHAAMPLCTRRPRRMCIGSNPSISQISQEGSYGCQPLPWLSPLGRDGWPGETI